MKALVHAVTLALCLSLGAIPALAGDPCSSLDADEKAAADRVMQAVYPHDCCDDTLAVCLAKEKPARLTVRLAHAVCRKIDAGRSEKEVIDAIERRGESMVPVGKPGTMDLSEVEWAGCEVAPVTVVAYACARCPFCSKVLPALYEDVVKGPLHKKVRLAFRPFPIKGHKDSTKGALAFAAARQLGALWPFLLKVYSEYDSFEVERIPGWATTVGIDSAVLESRMGEKETRQEVIASKKEGLRLGVKATPTLFVEGFPYKGDLDRDSVRDVLLEAWERKQGTVCQP